MQIIYNLSFARRFNNETVTIMHKRKKILLNRRSVARTSQKVRQPTLVSTTDTMRDNCKFCGQRESLEKSLEMSMKERSLLEEQLIQERNNYFDEDLEYYESRQALQEKNDTLQKELITQQGLSEVEKAAIVKAEKEKWEKKAEANIQCAVSNAIRQTIHECNKLLMPYTIRCRETGQNMRLVERKH